MDRYFLTNTEVFYNAQGSLAIINGGISLPENVLVSGVNMQTQTIYEGREGESILLKNSNI